MISIWFSYIANQRISHKTSLLEIMFTLLICNFICFHWNSRCCVTIVLCSLEQSMIQLFVHNKTKLGEDATNLERKKQNNSEYCKKKKKKKEVWPFGWNGKVGFLINAKCDGNRLSELIMTSWSTRFKRPLKSSLERREIAADRNIKSLGRWGDCNVLQMHETYSRCHIKIMFPTFFSTTRVLSGALLIVLHHCALFFWKFL